MKIFSAAQVKSWDAFTIANEPVSSLELMERAATVCFHWLQQQYPGKQSYFIFCGKGNNGGDGLAIARMLLQQKHAVNVFVLDTGREGSPDFKTNLRKLETLTFNIRTIATPTDLPELPSTGVVIDAVFGSGLNKPLTGLPASLVDCINKSEVPVIAIDIPSGLFADSSSSGNTVIAATHTLSLQQWKLSFLIQENEGRCGQVHVLDIGLHPAYEKAETSVYNWIDNSMAGAIYKPRRIFSHKGSYGHAALIAGSHGMLGAAILSAKGCLRAGAGKLTCIIPQCGYQVMQATVPEAMCRTSGDDIIENTGDTDSFNVIGFGPGIGGHASHTGWIRNLLQTARGTLVLDADALNVLAANTELLQAIPAQSVLTPHPKEFERLFGKTTSDFDRLQLALQKSKELNCYIVLKGHYSFISTPEGTGYFNSTGNPGMATAGSGDVLTGILTGLLAQGYSSLDACILGVYLHGLAGDLAAAQQSEEALIAGDIVEWLGKAFQLLKKNNPG